MVRALFLLRIGIGIATALQVGLGLYVWWSGNLAWLPAHLGLGLLLIAAMWVVTLLACRARVGFGRCLAIVGLTLLLPLFGMAQLFVTTGLGHWALLTLHLATAGAAISMSLRVGRLAQADFAQGESSMEGLSHAHA